MSVSKQRMLEMKKRMADGDRDAAMRTLMSYIHYRIAPDVPPRSPGTETRPVTLFENGTELEAFRQDNQLDDRALRWLLDDMKRANSIETENGKIWLTRNGVNEYCR
jgi:hypothetical protein